jgi:hypothetical protein
MEHVNLNIKETTNSYLGAVSGSVEYIQLLSTGTKAYWDERCKHFVSENRRFHVDLKSALKRTDMYIHYR